MTPAPSLSIALAAILLLCGDLALAQQRCPGPSGDARRDEQQARALFDQALQLEPAQPEAALDALACAERLASKPAVALRIGTIAERLGRRELAADAFERYLELAGNLAPDAEQMRARIAQLRKVAGESTRPAAAVDPERGDGQRLAGWVLTSAGAALAVIGVVLLTVAKVHSDEVHALASGTTAWDSEEARGSYESALREETLGAIGLIAGGSVAALGVFLIAVAPDGEARQAGSVVVPGGLGGSLRVAF